MDETPKKRVDESWKEQVDREKHAPTPAKPPAGDRGPARPGALGAGGGTIPAAEGVSAAGGLPTKEEGLPEARFELFVSGLAMEALIALGDAPHPVTRKQAANVPQARYLIDLLGVVEEKTRGNLSVDEERLLKDALYQLRMRYLAKTGAA